MLLFQNHFPKNVKYFKCFIYLFYLILPFNVSLLSKYCPAFPGEAVYIVLCLWSPGLIISLQPFHPIVCDTMYELPSLSFKFYHYKPWLKQNSEEFVWKAMCRLCHCILCIWTVLCYMLPELFLSVYHHVLVYLICLQASPLF